MNIELWLYIMAQPQIIPYEIAIILMIVGLIRVSQGSLRWDWQCQFWFEGISLAVSALLLLFFGRFSGFTYLGEALGALIGTIFSILIGIISIFVWRNGKKQTRSNVASAPADETEGSWPPPPTM